MADLLVPDGDTDRPSRPSSGSRPWAGRPDASSPAPSVDVLPAEPVDDAAARPRKGRGRGPRRAPGTTPLTAAARTTEALERGSVSGWASSERGRRPEVGDPREGSRRPVGQREPGQRQQAPEPPTAEQPTVEQPTAEQPTAEQPTAEQPTNVRPTDARTPAGSGRGPQGDGSSAARRGGGRRPRRKTVTPKPVPMPVEPEGGWTVEAVEEATFPTRMARRRALQSAQIENLWTPDPLITNDVLERVEDELARLLDRRVDLVAALDAREQARRDPLADDAHDDDQDDQDDQDDLDTSDEPDADDADDADDDDELDDAADHDVYTEGMDVEDSRVADRAADADDVNRSHAGARTTTGDLLPQAAGRSRRPVVRRVVTVLVALVCVSALVVWAVVGDGSRGRGTAAAPVTAPSQRVLAVALADAGHLTGMSLLASGPGGSQQVLVPSRLLLDVPGAGRIAVAQSLASGASAPGAALADALEIRVDGTWVLEAKDLAGMVDAVGGLKVDVDLDVTQGPGVGAKILVTQGAGQQLGGAQAVAFAQFLADGEPEAARLARQEQVVTALLAAMPIDRDARLALVSSGAAAPEGDVLESVLATTGALHDPARNATLGSTVLPVREIDSGGDVSSYGLDGAAAAAMVSSRLAGAVIVSPPGGRTRVLVQNGVGAPGLGDAARSRLVAAGLKYVGGGNVNGFGVRESVVVLSDGSSTSRARGLAVATALGLGESALRVSDSAPTIADLVVVLGADFRAR